MALGTADAEVITVCQDGCDYTSISAGIAAGNPGDTVEVHSGNYTENLIISKPITLRGVDSGSGKPLIDADYKESGIKLTADGITIDGFKVINSREHFWPDIWAGVEVASNNNTIANNTLVDNEHGILVEGFSNNTLIGNEVLGNKYGMKLKGCSGNKIIDNSLSENKQAGLYLISSANNDLQGNEASKGKYGIKLESSTDNRLRDNRMYNNSYNFGAGGSNDVDTSNLVGSRPIYYLVGLSNTIINSTSDAGAVYCLDCDNVSIDGLSLENNIYGIYLYNSTRVVIERISAINNSYGIWLKASEENVIRYNNASYNSVDGISLDESSYNLIEGNEIKENDQIGLSLIGSGFNLISVNNLSNNRATNLYLDEHCCKNSITSNNLTGSFEGIKLDSPWMSQITLNTINANERGICVVRGTKNNILRNIIDGNVVGLEFNIFSNFFERDNLWLNNTKDRSELMDNVDAPSGGRVRPEEVEEEVLVYIDPTPLGATAYLDGEKLGSKESSKWYYGNNGEDHSVELLKGETLIYSTTFKLSDAKDKLIAIMPNEGNIAR